MRIGDTLRKAAGLIVEFEEPSPEAEYYKTHSSTIKPSPAPTKDPLNSLADPVPQVRPTPAPEPVAAPRTVEQVVRDTPGPNLDEIRAPMTGSSDVIAADGQVNFGAIYHLAGLPTPAFTSEQVLDLFKSLPAELPIETKRATIKITIGAMTKSLGITGDTVVADASRKLAALAAYAQSYSEQADAFVRKSESEIVALEQEIARRKQAITDTKANQAKVSDACHTESDRLDDILEFFTLDVAPSKYAPS